MERDGGYRIGPWRDPSSGREGADAPDKAALPLVVEAGASDGMDRLCDWLRDESEAAQDRLAEHGAILFRGFAVDGPEGFERVARAIEPELGNEYLGTSPRDAVGPSGYVFSASELPGFYPIPQHCEMSFVKRPPRRVFFTCLVEPAAGSGETPLCDFRKVWRDLDPAVRERFERGGIRNVRNYAAPGSRGDAIQLKPWDDMFLTRDHAQVEAKCRENDFEPVWLEGDALRIFSTQPVWRDHPRTGERVWHNHTTTFHVTTAVAEYERIHRLRPSERHAGLLAMARKLVEEQRRRPSDELSMHSTYADGSEIPDADMDHVRDVVWRHMVIIPWRRGDVLAIDNHSTSHGRLPYEGPRQIAVCWAP